ncbi:nuclear transport factor 2 family protein [Streptomyces viridochromogenes]|uniref:nuclear transport factor 2 family protein n=1 Tax=Streptomyces viridochromogenes TaxID=1938 RepID=UPI00065C73C6|nr:nuclear transport factor 2 family protein [Streptomyces viridochromogenes]
MPEGQVAQVGPASSELAGRARHDIDNEDRCSPMTSDSLDPDLRRLIDREAIRDVLNRYCRSVDRLDLDELRRCYHHDAYDNHGAYQGDIDGLIAWIAHRHETIPYSLHISGNILIEFAGDDLALVESYNSIVQHYPADARASLQQFLGEGAVRPDGALHFMTWGRFIDRMLRRDGEWKIIRRTLVAGPTVVLPTARPFEAPMGWASDRRDDQDVLHAERRELRIG